MSTTAIVLLVLGVAFFGASFFLPDGKKRESETKIDDKVVKEMVEKELDSVRDRITEMVDETVTYSVEKTERQLEKLSNEKIMAVDEYSETVLKQINDNHQEAVFLYDMLNEKGERLKNTNREMVRKEEELKEKDKALEVKEEILKAKADDINAQKEEIRAEIEKKEDSFVPFIVERVSVVNNVVEDKAETGKVEKTEPEPVEVKEPENAEKAVTPAKPRTVKKPVTGKNQRTPRVKTQPAKTNSETAENDENGTSVEVHFDRDNDSKKNKNEQIRKMHEEGKSNMAIAKELGLGVGEVKLVIDLFANKR